MNVPVYRVEAYLKKCVHSILAQDMEEDELILADDGSPDSCGFGYIAFYKSWALYNHIR